MNPFRLVSVLVMAAFSMVALTAYSKTSPQSVEKGSITIKAHIDSKSRLIMQGNTAQWFHIDFAAPGRHQFRNLPTIINDVEWFPTWPDEPDAENRFCECFSDIFEGVDPALPRKFANYELEEVQARRPVTIFQIPEAANDYTLIIEFHNDVAGSDDYEVILKFDSQFQINAGHAGAWFNPETSGQGQFIDVVPEEQFMFISWFTFTDTASDNPNEQQWYTAQGNYSGDTAVLELFETLGGKFDDPQEVTTTQVGEVTLSFSDCDQGQMTYNIDGEELLGEFPMIRVIPGSDNVCEGLSGNNTEAVDINAGMDGAWFDPDTSGQGYFIDAHPDPEGGNFIFVSWFTYGDATASGQRWLTAQGSFEGSMAEIDVFETTGGSFDDPEPVSITKVGTMSLDFTDCSNAQLSYSLPADPAEGDIAITRVIPGSQALCKELAGDD